MPGSGRRAISCVATLLAYLPLALPVLAQQDSFRYYGTDEGLTSVAVKVLFQDRTGFLWVGTENGLFRYDGQRFQRYGSADGLKLTKPELCDAEWQRGRAR